MAVVRHWPLHQLDNKNGFLHGDFEKEFDIEEQLGFVAHGESSNLVSRLCRSLYSLK